MLNRTRQLLPMLFNTLCPKLATIFFGLDSQLSSCAATKINNHKDRNKLAQDTWGTVSFLLNTESQPNSSVYFIIYIFYYLVVCQKIAHQRSVSNSQKKHIELQYYLQKFCGLLKFNLLWVDMTDGILNKGTNSAVCSGYRCQNYLDLTSTAKLS